MPGGPTISSAEARGLAIAAQRLGSRDRAPDVPTVLNSLGAIQLDTISVLARSHELVAHARLRQSSRAAIEASLWSSTPIAFEYWSHAACLLPLSNYPLFAFRRRAFRRRGIRWHEVPSARLLNQVRKRLADGPATATELGGAKRAGPWWDWTQTKIAVEWLLDIGDVVCLKRAGWRRVYQLADDSLLGSPGAEWLTVDGCYGPSDSECLDELLLRGVGVVGVGTVADIADIHRLVGHGVTKAALRVRLERLADDGRIGRVDVDGWEEPAFRALGLEPARSTSVALSPFDSLVWNRARVLRLFGVDFRLEAYTPAAARQHGYFAMPILHRNRIVALLDPGRKRVAGGTAMVAKQVTFTGPATIATVEGVAAALRRAAEWVAAREITVEQVRPASAARPLRDSLRTIAR